MSAGNSALHRLLRSAATLSGDNSPSPPFGFETRVVALWRSGNSTGFGNGIARLIRRVAAVAACVILICGAASYYEFQEAQAIGEPGANEFAIADSAIQNEFYR